MAIHFPKLKLTFSYVPRSFMVLGQEITVEGILIALMLLIGFLAVRRSARKKGLDPNLYLGAALCAVIGGFAGARAVYVFLKSDSFAGNVIRMLNVRTGGLNFYGALLGGVVGAWLFCVFSSKASVGQAMDILVGPFVAGEAIVRWGDFFNREGFGPYTDSFAAMALPLSTVRSSQVTDVMRQNLVDIRGVSHIQVFPLFLVESLLCLALAIYLAVRSRANRFKGESLWRYLFWGSLIVGGCAYFRTDSLMAPEIGIPFNTAVAVPLAVVALMAVLITRSLTKKREDVKKARNERYRREDAMRAEEERRQRERERTRREDLEERALKIRNARYQAEAERSAAADAEQEPSRTAPSPKSADSLKSVDSFKSMDIETLWRETKGAEDNGKQP